MASNRASSNRRKVRVKPSSKLLASAALVCPGAVADAEVMDAAETKMYRLRMPRSRDRLVQAAR